MKEKHGLFGPQNQHIMYFLFKKKHNTNKHILYVSFIKDFKVMKIWEKRGPKSDFLTWFYCFSVNTENV